ncbi:hypothetical protein HS088_TW02G00497 [Tripterygium wilfordii]|uniref:Uncharacterized protein n=1 Tax=Tripterygium wilfordii TaxID=458696 RepID=A0A7J7DYV1_TRIWF|nr:uncharacterized protein LOC120016053 [Tripterygium wilfordii]KAF5751483.1 hypothetical protein HS088_TW02G00497 [Tripterygium wilfordii]
MKKRKSSPSILRLDDEPETPRQTTKSLIAGLSSSSAAASTPWESFKLPDDWVVERSPRARSNQVDKYYIEPGLDNSFIPESLVSVERYLAGWEEYCTPKAIKPSGFQEKETKFWRGG